MTNNIDKDSDVSNQPASHWQVLSDVLAFQFKLAMDGLRDLLLSPISIIAAIAGLVSSRSDPGRYFYRLLNYGHRTDRWINLFNTYTSENTDNNSEVSADHFVRRAEQIVLNEYHKGGAVQDIKRRADGVIDKLHTAKESKVGAKKDDGQGQ